LAGGFNLSFMTNGMPSREVNREPTAKYWSTKFNYTPITNRKANKLCKAQPNLTITNTWTIRLLILQLCLIHF